MYTKNLYAITIMTISLMNILRTKEQEGLQVIYITDISKGGETPKEIVWTYNLLKSHMKEKKVSLVRFNFLDMQVCVILLL